MEQVKYYLAIIEEQRKPYSWEDENSELHWIIIGTFDNEKDAQIACKLYMIASNDKVNKSYGNSNCTGNYVVVNELSLPKRLLRGPVYESLDNFIKGNLQTALYSKKIGEEAMKKLLKEIDDEIENKNNVKKQQDRKEFNSIIERMIRHYTYVLKIDEATGTDEKTIKEYKENIQLLEDLRDSKIELK